MRARVRLPVSSSHIMYVVYYGVSLHFVYSPTCPQYLTLPTPSVWLYADPPFASRPIRNTEQNMKNSTATHVLGLLLAAAASASAATAGAFGGSAVPEQQHVTMQASAGGGSLVGDGEMVTAGAFGGSGVPEEQHPAMQASAGGGSLVGDVKAAPARAGAFGGSGVPEKKHVKASAGGGSLVRDSHGAYSHDMLRAHVHGKGGGIGQGLLHPLPHYLVGFLGWSYEYGMGWTSMEDALHALEVTWLARDLGCWFSRTLRC